MAFCRMCGTELDPGERYCHRCGTLLEQSYTLSPQPTAQPILEPLQRTPILQLSPKLRQILNFAIPLVALIVFASYLLGQHIIHTEVKTIFLDDYFYYLVVSGLHSNPTDYYSIADHVFRQLVTGNGPTGGFVVYFPLILYIWFLVPNIGDIKWLYFVFAIAGIVASYFAVYAVTKQGLVAFLSGAWMVYFMQTSLYLMIEYWAISVFLIGLAFFLMKRHLWAAVAVGMATLIKITTAPFMIFASLYYLAASRKEWEPYAYYLMTGKHRETWREIQFSKGPQSPKTKIAYVWTGATTVVALAYLLNELAGGAGPLAATGIGLVVHYPQGFEPGVLAGLFGYFLNPPLPIIVAVALALIGIAFLDKDQSIIMYASFAFFPLLIPSGVVQIPQTTLANWTTWTNVPARWLGISMTVVNLFWLVGPYKVCEYIYRRTRAYLLSSPQSFHVRS